MLNSLNSSVSVLPELSFRFGPLPSPALWYWPDRGQRWECNFWQDPYYPRWICQPLQALIYCMLLGQTTNRINTKLQSYNDIRPNTTKALAWKMVWSVCFGRTDGPTPSTNIKYNEQLFKLCLHGGGGCVKRLFSHPFKVDTILIRLAKPTQTLLQNWAKILKGFQHGTARMQ